MIKIYFKLEYVVFYGMEDQESIEDRYIIGFFSSKQKATSAINEYIKLEIDKFSIDNFIIRRVYIKHDNEPVKLFLPYHEYSIVDENNEYSDFYYIFSPKATKKEAEDFCLKMKTRKKYAKSLERDYSMYPPDGFGIDEYIVNKIYH